MSFQEGHAKTGFATAAEYGWCETDRPRKNPRKKRIKNMDGSLREDYFLSENHRRYTEFFFDEFELPMPTDDMVYRGNSQDLLFLDNLGLVVRTGPIDVIDMIHPGILQPLYWMPFCSNDHVIALYPGIQLSTHLYNKKFQSEFDGNRDGLVEFLKTTGQSTIDSRVDHNFGYCDGQLIVLDTEEFCFGSKTDALKGYKENSYAIYTEAGCSPNLAIRQVMVEMYGDMPEFEKWIATYDYHQPLREQIEDALNEADAGFRYEMLEAFYQRCRDCVAGNDPEVALYSPWTGKPEDNLLKSQITHRPA